ncbi:Ulp1 protease family, carboxy-terminal domain protein [Arachis hypogaea]|nr:Ulp1 protease family, carboxy-terminal domain protein [Arachis hypogaea]
MDNWPLYNARGIPDCNTSDNSAIWLLEWMAMEDMFQPNLTARPPDSKIRMLAACTTLNGTHNEYNDMVRHRSAARWKALVGN